MGHGAPKNIEGIRTQDMVEILALEGILHSYMEDMLTVLKRIFEGKDSPADWVSLQELRWKVVHSNQQYTKRIQRFESSQHRG